MSLSVGIVGLPNAGKSTLFNALAAKRLAETAPRPFTTIEPHEAVVSVPDKNLDRLWELVRGDPSASLRMTEQVKIIPVSVTFIDIAGLVKGAHKGEGLGNQFLAKIREVNTVAHVVRGFVDAYVTHQHPRHEPGTLQQILEDIAIVNLEIQLAGIVKKPTIYVLNVGEREVSDEPEMSQWIVNVTEKYKDPAIVVAGKLEEELSDLNTSERTQYLIQIGVEKTGLEQLISWTYKLLDLITFYTVKGGLEVTAWSLEKGSSAIDAAETVHTDFAKNFIKAEVINVEKLLRIGGPASTRKGEPASTNLGEPTRGGWKSAKEKGLIRLEGKDYVVQDKDVIEFKIGV